MPSSVYTATVCVCEQAGANTTVGESHEPLNSPKTACVSVHTHTVALSRALSTTYYCIQYNYIQQTNGEINRVCIQSDYTGGGGRAGA